MADPADLVRIGRSSAPVAPYATPPAALPPEPDDGVYFPADDIRASRAAHSNLPS